VILLAKSICYGCAGPRETVRFLPPLNVSSSEMQQGLSIYGEALEEVFSQ
jgi:4-aminobutyrate aminotransferase-like enzyme